MKSRIGFNIHAQFVQDTPRLKAHLQAVQPASVLVMDGLGLAQEIKALLPDCIVINRIYPDDDIHNRKSPTDWMNERAPQAAGGIFQYSTNEAGFSPNLIQWHIELCHLAIQRNVPLVIGNMSVGTPAPEDWAAGRELFELMNTRRDLFILGLHEYACGVITSGFLGGAPNSAGVPIGESGGVNLIPSANWPTPTPTPMYHCGRVQFLIDYCNSVGIQTPRVILTEHGFDDVSDIKAWSQTLQMTPPYTSIRGWRSIENQWRAWYGAQGWSSQRAYFEQVKYADQTIYKGSPVEAQLLFCWARPDNSNWEQFDLSDASEFQALLETYTSGDTDTDNGGTEPPVTTKIDLLPYFNALPGRRKYELGHNAAMGGGTELLQTQGETPDARIFRHVKQGGASPTSKWERLCNTDNYIYRDLDTSGDVEVYRLSDAGKPWSKWCPRHMTVGEKFRRNPKVTWHNKQTGAVIRSYDEASDLKFVGLLPSWTSPIEPVTIADVIVLEYSHPGGNWIERYYYGKNYGLVGWENRDGWKSGVSVAQSPHPAPIPEQLGAWANPPPVPTDSAPQPQPPTQPAKPANAAEPVAFTVPADYRLRFEPDTSAASIGMLQDGEHITAYRVPETNNDANLWHFIERAQTPAGEAAQGYSAVPLPAPTPPDPEPEPPDSIDIDALKVVYEHVTESANELHQISLQVATISDELKLDADILKAIIEKHDTPAQTAAGIPFTSPEVHVFKNVIASLESKLGTFDAAARENLNQLTVLIEDAATRKPVSNADVDAA